MNDNSSPRKAPRIKKLFQKVLGTTIKDPKINTTIPINTIKTVSVGDKVNITGKLLDSNNKPIANANITVKVNNKSYTTTTNSKNKVNPLLAA